MDGFGDVSVGLVFFSHGFLRLVGNGKNLHHRQTVALNINYQKTILENSWGALGRPPSCPRFARDTRRPVGPEALFHHGSEITEDIQDVEGRRKTPRRGTITS